MLKVFRCVGIILAVFWVSSFFAWGDTIYFKDGSSIQVEDAWEENDKVKCMRFGGLITYPKSKVDRIERGEAEPESSSSPEPRVEERPIKDNRSMKVNQTLSLASIKAALSDFTLENPYKQSRRERSKYSYSPSHPEENPLKRPDPLIREAKKPVPKKFPDLRKLSASGIPHSWPSDNSNVPHHYLPCRPLKYVPLLDLPNQHRPDPNAVLVPTGHPIFKAILYKDLEEVKRVVQKEPQCVHYIDWHGETPLIVAATLCKVNIAKFLIDQGADVNAGSNSGLTPIMGAAVYRSSYEVSQHEIRAKKKNPRNAQREMIKLLISKGADINAVKHAHTPCNCDCEPCKPKEHKTSFGMGGMIGTAFQLVHDEELMEFLLANGADVNAVDRYGNTKAHREFSRIGAVNNDSSTRIVRFLMKHGADLTIRNVWGKTPFEVAIAKDRRAELEEIMNRLEKPLPSLPYCTEELTTTIIRGSHPKDLNKITANCGSVKDILKMLKSNPEIIHGTTAEFETPLHTACETDHPEAVRILLKHGADPNAISSWGNTPLHLAPNDEIMTLLLDHGADPNIKNCNGRPASDLVDKVMLKVNKWKEELPALEKSLAIKAKLRGP